MLLLGQNGAHSLQTVTTRLGHLRLHLCRWMFVRNCPGRYWSPLHQPSLKTLVMSSALHAALRVRHTRVYPSVLRCT